METHDSYTMNTNKTTNISVITLFRCGGTYDFGFTPNSNRQGYLCPRVCKPVCNMAIFGCGFTHDFGRGAPLAREDFRV